MSVRCKTLIIVIYTFLSVDEIRYHSVSVVDVATTQCITIQHTHTFGQQETKVHNILKSSHPLTKTYSNTHTHMPHSASLMTTLHAIVPLYQCLIPICDSWIRRITSLCFTKQLQRSSKKIVCTDRCWFLLSLQSPKLRLDANVLGSKQEIFNFWTCLPHSYFVFI